MAVINGNNVQVIVAGSGTAVLPTYFDNVKTVFDEHFTSENSNFTLVNSATSENGLVMNSFGSALINKNTKMVAQQTQTRFVFSEDIVFGLYMNGCFACVDTSQKTFTLYSSYAGNSTMPTTVKGTANIADDFVVGNEYTITMSAKNPQSMTTVFRDIASGNEAVIDSTFSPTRTYKDSGVALFSGSVIVRQLLYRVPLYNHAKCICVGDSTTWNGGLDDFEAESWGFITVGDYFHNDGVISARGGDNVQGGMASVTELFDYGWTFDYIIMALGTNVSWPMAPNHSYAEQIQAQRRQFASFEALCAQHGGVVLWCAPPAYSSDDLSESLEEAEADTTTMGNPSRVILRKLIIDVFGDRCIRFDLATMTNGAYDSQYFLDGVHPNALGNGREAKYVQAKLMELNYH